MRQATASTHVPELRALVLDYTRRLPPATLADPSDCAHLVQTNALLQQALSPILSAARVHPDPAEALPAAPIYVGLSPRPDYNTSIQITTFGLLVLVNARLYETLHHLALLHACVTTFADPNGHVRSTAPLALEKRGVVFRSTLEVFSQRRLPTLDWLPTLDAKHKAFAADLWVGSLQFLLAHEVAHAMLGHLTTDTPQIDENPTDEEARAVATHQSQEHDADHLAMELNIRCGGPRPGQHPELPYAGGVFYALATSAVMSADLNGTQDADLARMRALYWETKTHPLPFYRMAYMVSRTHPDRIEADLPFCDMLVRNQLHLLGGSEPYRNKAALQTLSDLAQRDKAVRQELERIVRDPRGVRPAGPTWFMHLLNLGRDAAKTVLAHLSVSYFAHALCLRPVAAVWLGRGYVEFARTFLSDRIDAEAQAFDALLRRAIPEVDGTVAAALSYGVAQPCSLG